MDVSRRLVETCEGSDLPECEALLEALKDPILRSLLTANEERLLELLRAIERLSRRRASLPS